MSGGMYGTSSGAGGAAIFTDDVSLQVFMEHLKRLVRPCLSFFESHGADLCGYRLWARKRTRWCVVVCVAWSLDTYSMSTLSLVLYEYVFGAIGGAHVLGQRVE